MTKPLTGRKVFAIAVCCFGLVIGANLAMLFAATGTFPGLVVQNSYVASQGWNDRVEAQKELGWQGAVAHDGEWLEIRLTDRAGEAVTAPALAVVVGRPTTDADDVVLQLAAVDGAYRTRLPLAPGLWRIEAETADGPAFIVRSTLSVQVN